ncbi:acyltransferase [Sphingobacterium hungaricum]
MEIIRAEAIQDVREKWMLLPTDKACLDLLIKGTWIYSCEIDLADFKKSLGKLLSYYPHLSGRLIESSYIEMNNEGVPLHLFAYENTPIEDIYKEKNPLDSYNPGISIAQLKKGKIAPLSIQLSKMSDGYLLSVHASHACLDGNSFYAFMKNWADIAQQQSIDPPLLNQQLIPQPVKLDKVQLLKEVKLKNWHKISWKFIAKAIVQQFQKSSKIESLFISNANLIAMRNAIKAHNGETYGRHVLLSSFVSKFSMHILNSSSNQNFRQISVVDIRQRIASLPETFVGNATAHSISPEFSNSQNLAEIAEKINQSLIDSFKNNGQELSDSVQLNSRAIELQIPYVPFDVEAMEGNNISSFYCNNLLKFPVYDVDFGSGKPIYVFPNDLKDQIKFGLRRKQLRE